MPVFAAKVLHGGAHTLGFLMGALGAGALAGAVSLALRKTVLGLGRVIAVSSVIFGAGLIAFGFSRFEWLSMALMVVTGYGMMRQMAASNTIIQTVVPEDKRGRVMSYYTMAFVGMAPFGSLLAGALAHWVSAPLALVITGACCIVAAGWFMTQLPNIRLHIRPIYRELGILPPEVISVMADGGGD
jgi:MFS family permease